MNIQTLLGSVPKAEFIEQHYHRFPFTLAGGGQSVCELGAWELLGEILGQEGVDVMVVREGRRFAGPDPTTLEQAQQLNREGYTILVRHAERHHAPLNRLAAAFAGDFHAPVNIHLYATPAGQHGFSWHYDAEDVFIVQTSGTKEYSLRKNTVHPWPLVETIPDDMDYGREIMPLMRVLLSAGDWLYIPCGYWHKAEAGNSDGTAISLAIGIMSPAAIDVYDFLRPRLRESLLWRQRLPTHADGSPSADEQCFAQLCDLFGQLADDVAMRLRDEHVIREFLNQRSVHNES